MQIFNGKGVVGLLVAVVTGLVSLEAQAERIEQTYVRTGLRVVSKNALRVGDVANHEIGQELVLCEIEYSSSNFRIKEDWLFHQFNIVDGSGSHRGNFIDIHEDGSQTFGIYEGSQKTIVTSDGSWVHTWEGKYQYLGGTGKYKHLKGSGTYQGRASSTEAAREEGREIIEY
jgi:hypothetical protein